MNQTSLVRSAGLAHGGMDEFDIAAMLFNDSQEPDMDAIIDTADRRNFRQTRRSTSFFGFTDVTYRRVSGRIGGDVGNRKRRYDNSVEVNERERAEKRAAREAIAFGVAEYENDRRPVKLAAFVHGAQQKDDRGRSSHTDSGYGEAPEGTIGQGRTGHVVQVVVKPTRRDLRKKAFAAVAGKRPTLSIDQVRAAMHLPARQ